MKKLTKEKTLVNFSLKLFDFYWSFDHGKGGFKICPYIEYKITFEARNSINQLMKETEILKKNGDSLGKTNNRGTLIVWLPRGKTTVKATVLGETHQKTVNIKEEDAGSKKVLKFGAKVSARDYLTGAADSVDDTVIVIAHGKCGENVKS